MNQRTRHELSPLGDDSQHSRYLLWAPGHHFLRQMQIVAPPKLEAMHHIHVVEFIDNALTMSDHHVDGASEERQV